MKKKVSIVTSGHPYYDERIFYKFARSLAKNDYDVSIICSTAETEIDLVKDNIHILGFNGSNLKKSRKLNKFEELLAKAKPSVVICCEPFPILAANRIRKKSNKVKIIYDVTEWYPENVAFKFYGFKRLSTYALLFILNIFASNLADAIIIGEKSKSKRYKLIAPFKRKQIVSYYPILEFFHPTVPKFNGRELILCYAGLLKFDRGIKQLLEAAVRFSDLNQNLLIKLKLIGKFESIHQENEIKEIIKGKRHIDIEFIGWIEYPKLSEQFSDVHICFDLRENNFIYRNSLPIKIFEYMACGKPFIFSDIKPIKDEIEYKNCGFLVNPQSISEIIKAVEEYLNENKLMELHGKNARKLIEEKYNWEKESVKLVEFLGLIQNSK